MRRFDTMPCEEALGVACALLCRVTLPGEDAALAGLTQLFDALAQYELPRAVRAYHDVTRVLLTAPARRVCGDLWRDYLLYLVLQTPHPFARMAAAGEQDDALCANMREELAILGALSTLGGKDIARYVAERQRETQFKPRQAKDSISVMSSAVWSGATMRPLPRPEKGEEAGPSGAAAPVPFTFTPWQYGEEAMRGSFVCDEALEELYARLLHTPQWDTLTEDMRCFFASYGCGDFLRGRAFRQEGAGLASLPEAVIMPLVPTTLYEPQRTELIENTIRFMRGEPACHMLLYGDSGTGKTAYVLALLHELPEVRLVLADLQDIAGLLHLLRALAAQPLRFIVLLDNIDPGGKGLRGLRAGLCSLHALPPNVLLCATAREGCPPEGDTFPLCLHFARPNMADFTQLVCDLLEEQGVPFDRQAVHEACVDYQVDARDRLGYAAGQRVAGIYARGE
ncbi:MAG: DUF815 domain-containing protein [Christensenellaceae bacterium]|nr:DUF815 domain-containing protein [Christensenellaceae bacterium]